MYLRSYAAAVCIPSPRQGQSSDAALFQALRCCTIPGSLLFSLTRTGPEVEARAVFIAEALFWHFYHHWYKSPPWSVSLRGVNQPDKDVERCPEVPVRPLDGNRLSRASLATAPIDRLCSKTLSAKLNTVVHFLGDTNLVLRTTSRPVWPNYIVVE